MTSRPRHRVLYVSKASYHHYKEIDRKILSERYDVTRFDYRYSPASLAKLASAVRDHDLVFTWFASPMAAAAVAFARAFGKRSAVVAGGYDVANYAPMKHGMAHRPVQRHFARFALDHADLVLPVSRFNEAELLRFASPRSVVRVENAVDLPPVDLDLPRANTVVTLGAVEKFYSKIKGHERLVRAAKHLPDVRFLVVGPHEGDAIHAFRKIAPSNVEFPGLVPHERLVELLATAKAYAQLSHYESFGVAVAEAMWCGCTPVVSAIPALVEIVGGTGVVVDDADDPRAAADGIRRALDAPSPNRAAAARAADFSVEVRRKKLLDAVSALLET